MTGARRRWAAPALVALLVGACAGDAGPDGAGRDEAFTLSLVETLGGADTVA